MTSRGRGCSSSNDWDTTRDNFAYDQYTDDNSSTNIQYDNTRLYITNVPLGLNEQGLREAFSRFGTLEESHLSRDPKKRYALVKYETAGEARVAMMKMNRTEPLCLNVNIARKTKNNAVSTASERPSTNGFNERPRREDSTSVVSRKSRPTDEPSNGGESKGKRESDMGLEIDRNLHVELENLKLEELKIRNEQLKIKEQELACKQRLLLLQQNDTKRTVPNQNSGSNRCLLPDGRIIVRNNDKFQDDRDASFTAGAGDSLNIPGLQRIGARSCIGCGAEAEFYCSRCGVAPYCSELCQRRDWADRHKDVCHNLQRVSASKSKQQSQTETLVPPAAPLRRPNVRREDDNDSDKSKSKYQQRESSQTSNNNKWLNNNKPTNNNNNNRNRNFTPNKDLRRPQIRNENDLDKPATSIPTPKTPEAIESQPNKPQPIKPEAGTVQIPNIRDVKPQAIKPQTAKPEGVDPQTIKPAEPKPSPQRSQLAVKINSMGNVAESAKMKELKPDSYLIEKLSIGDSFLLSIESPTSECDTKQRGFVCLSLHEDFSDDYDKLCNDYAVYCENNKDVIVPTPNAFISYLSPSDGGWYRARCLTSTKVALLDAAKVTTLEGTTCKTVSKEYTDIPEFSAVINGPGLKIGMNLQCKLKSKTANGFKVLMTDSETDTEMGEGEIERWMPEVEIPPPAPVTPGTLKLPTVSRPDLINSSKVVLLDCKSFDKACIRPADQESTIKFDSILNDVILYAMKASPLKEPPQMGVVVISEFTDGLQYRALVKRTNVKSNKYLVEYIEFGNEEVVPIEKLYPCPANLDLSTVPTVASIVKLSTKTDPLTPSALELIENLKDNNVPLILTIPSGEKQAPSGALVQLNLEKNGENITRKLEDMCTPEWVKIEERGGDVLETTPIMFNAFPTLKLPTDRPFTLQVVDFSAIDHGCVSGFVQGEPIAKVIYGELTDKISKYATSDLCKLPYLPKLEELCITQRPPSSKWHRAVFTKQVDGAGGKVAQVMFVDHGNLETVPVSHIRKMLPEFVDGYPGLACLCEIKDFPKNVTHAQLELASELLNLNDEGHGTLNVKSCRDIGATVYEIEVPDFIAALKAV